MGPAAGVQLRALTRAERAELERVGRASSARQDQVRRAGALLAVAAGHSFRQAAQQAGFRSGSSVAGLVARFNATGLAALGIAPGRGRRARYDRAARTQIVATAQRTPQRQEDGTASWSLLTLQRAVRRSGLAHVGASTIRRVLRDAGSSYQLSRQWCPTGTAIRKRKSGTVVVVDPQTEKKRG